MIHCYDTDVKQYFYFIAIELKLEHSVEFFAYFVALEK